MRIRIVFSLFFCAVVWVAKPQQTAVYTEKNADFGKGKTLFLEKQYAAAKEVLLRFSENERPQGIIGDETDYMLAVAAAENSDKDAEKRLQDFLKNHRHSDRAAYVNYYLGRYYYLNKRYQECIEQLSALEAGQLPEEHRISYQYQLAYCYFVTKAFDKAQPLFAIVKNTSGEYQTAATYYYAFISFFKKQYNEALVSFQQIETLPKFASVVPYYVSQIYYLKRDYAKAAEYIRLHIARAEEQYREEMEQLLGESYFQLSEYEKALPLLEKRIAKGEKVRKEDIYELAYSQYKTKKYSDAIVNFLQLNLMDDTLGQNATYALADCYLKSGEKENAKAAFQSASTKNFDAKIKYESLFNYAKLSLESGNPTECVSALKQLLSESAVHQDEANELMATALLQTKDYTAALSILEKLPSLSASLKAAYQRVAYFRAVQLFNDGEQAEALVLCEKSLKYPVNMTLQGGANYIKGELFYKQGKYADAYVHYRKFTQFATPSDEAALGFSKTIADYNAAYCLFKQKQYSRALVGFQQVVSANNTEREVRDDAQLRVAECAFVLKSNTVALASYDAVAQSNSPEAEYAQFQKGIVLGLLDKTNEKITVLKELTVRFSGSKTVDKAHFEIGNTYLDMNNSESAINSFTTLIQNYPQSALVPSAHLRIALAQYNLNEKDKALETYKFVAKNYSSSPEAKQSLSSIKDLSVELGRPDEYTAIASISESEKDSLLWEAAEIAYNANDCGKAVPLLGKYLTQFPNGFFAQQAHFYRSECYLKQTEYATILTDYDALIASPTYRERALLNASGIAYFELKNYDKALSYYKQLAEVSTSTQNTYTAIAGAFKSAVQMNNSDEILTAANQILSYPQAKESDVLEAHYYKAKADYAAGNTVSAFAHFDSVSATSVSERAAEAKYMNAKILNENKEYKASLDTCFKIKNQFASYEKWYVKTFILMADNYYGLDNALQAKATLESIVANYKGDQSLIDEAAKKLDEVNNAELKKSLIETEMPSDTLQMIGQ